MLFLLGVTTLIFSQNILVSTGVGGYYLGHGDTSYSITPIGTDGTVRNGVKLGLNILFIGESGFTISTGMDVPFNPNAGVNVDAIFGLGYIYYNKFYLGGIINIIPKPYIIYNDGNNYGDGFFTPTVVAGYDFRHFLLDLQISYMHGFVSSISGFRCSLGIGINVGNIIRNN